MKSLYTNAPWYDTDTSQYVSIQDKHNYIGSFGETSIWSTLADFRFVYHVPIPLLQYILNLPSLISSECFLLLLILKDLYYLPYQILINHQKMQWIVMWHVPKPSSYHFLQWIQCSILKKKKLIKETKIVFEQIWNGYDFVMF